MTINKNHFKYSNGSLNSKNINLVTSSKSSLVCDGELEQFKEPPKWFGNR